MSSDYQTRTHGVKILVDKLFACYKHDHKESVDLINKIILELEALISISEPISNNSLRLLDMVTKLKELLQFSIANAKTESSSSKV